MDKPHKYLTDIGEMVWERLNWELGEGSIKSVRLFIPPNNNGEVAAVVVASAVGHDLGDLNEKAAAYAAELCSEFEVEEC